MAIIRTPRKSALIITAAIVFLLFMSVAGSHLYHYTARNTFCLNCHEMQRPYDQWKTSTHYNGKSGVVANCVDCHLPQGSFKKMFYKSYFGVRDVYAHFFKDISKIDWKEKRKHMSSFVFEDGCLSCHVNLFPSSLSKGGLRAHKEYSAKLTEEKCFECHEHQNLVHKERQP
jgi:cytochrome c nitrite reductase small subunit